MIYLIIKYIFSFIIVLDLIIVFVARFKCKMIGNMACFWYTVVMMWLLISLFGGVR